MLEAGHDRIPSMARVNTQGINKKILFQHFRAGVKSNTQKILQNAIHNSTFGFFLQNPDILDDLKEENAEDSMMIHFDQILNTPIEEGEDI